MKFTEAHSETREIEIIQDITTLMSYCQLTYGKTTFYSEVIFSTLPF